jgi:hypothetical protein
MKMINTVWLNRIGGICKPANLRLMLNLEATAINAMASINVKEMGLLAQKSLACEDHFTGS